MKDIPKALFIIDPRREKNAIKEAKDMGIPVIALAGSDCNIKGIDFPIMGNDASQASIQYFVQEIAKAYSEAKEVKKA